MLQNARYLISTAESVQVGQELLKGFAFDLVILALNENDFILDWLFSEPAEGLLNIPLLLLTQSTLPPSISNQLSLRGQGYLTQPFPPAEFLASVQTILNKHPGNLPY